MFLICFPFLIIISFFFFLGETLIYSTTSAYECGVYDDDQNHMEKKPFNVYIHAILVGIVLVLGRIAIATGLQIDGYTSSPICVG